MPLSRFFRAVWVELSVIAGFVFLAVVARAVMHP